MKKTVLILGLLLLLSAPRLLVAQSGPSLFTFSGGCPKHFGASVCDSITDTLTLLNISGSDDTLIALTVAGDSTVFKPVLALPVRIPIFDSLLIPLRGLAAIEGQFAISLTATVRSADRVQTIDCRISLAAAGIHIFGGFNFPILVHCGVPSDTAVWLFAPTCEDMKVAHIFSGGPDSAKLSINTTSIQLPVTIHKWDSSQSLQEVRIPIHFSGVKPGHYYTSVVYDGTVADGTPFDTAIPFQWIVDSGVNVTPKHLTPTSQTFGFVPECDSATLTFVEQFGDTCHFIDTMVEVVSQLSGAPNPEDYKILHLPSLTHAYGQIDSLVVAWPFGAKQDPFGGWVRITYRHGNDSTHVLYSFFGTAAPCPPSDVHETDHPAFSIRSDGKQLLIALGDATPATFELQNVLGETILTSSISGSASIDDRSLAPGVYFYRVTIGSRVITGKITLP